MIYRQKNKKTTKINNKMTNKSNKSAFKAWTSGVIFCLLWYLSILFGFFMLICPLLPLVVFNPKLYRKWSDLVFGMWEPYPVAMMEILFGVRTFMNGDKFNPFEGSIVVMNHRTRLDWNFLWAGMFHYCQPHSHSLKFILKAPIMHIPGPGWVMQACSFLFIHRNWEKDQMLLSRILDYLKESNEVCQILIFPEGTDLSEKNIQRSHKFADDHNLERYYRVLHPKTTGFAFLGSRMRANGQLDAVYDLTVGYPKTLPETELDMLRGKFPDEIHFYLKRYQASAIPAQESELKNWLNEIWKEKEERLQKFYKNGSFTNHDCTPDCLEQNSTNELLKRCSVMHESAGLNNCKELLNFQNGINRDLNNHYQKENTNRRYIEHSEVLKQNMINNEIQLTTGIPGLAINDTSNRKMQNEPNSSSYPTRRFFRNQLDYEQNLLESRYRPSHLLYLSLLFWTSLIFFSIYGLFTNFYLQIWTLVHFLLFVALSFVSNGFHQVVATFYLYNHKKRGINVQKKYE